MADTAAQTESVADYPELAPFLDPVSGRVNMLGLSEAKLKQVFTIIGEKPFRATQVLKWIHQLGAEDFDSMTNVSKALRARLSALAEIRPPEVVERFDSSDGTRKWVMRVNGGSCIETVFIPEKERGTLCVSSQVGCSLDCKFCSTGKQGFQRDLTASEIVGQLWIAAKSFDSLNAGADRVVSNVVFMGMGEPLLNFDNVVDSVQLMLADNGYGLSKRRVTISTSGVVPALDRLHEYVDASLAISLHAPNDALRDELVPINRRYPSAMLLQSCREYMEALPDTHRVTTVEYTLIAGVNDQPQHARELCQLLADFPCKINLIPFNPFPHSGMEKPSRNAVLRFRRILQEADFCTTIRTTRGDDIDAACGQLVGRVADRTKRSSRHQEAVLAAQAEAQAVNVIDASKPH